MAPNIESAKSTSDKAQLSGRKASNSHGKKDEDRGKSIKFSLFELGQILVEYCNFSLIPYYYDPRYGTGQRVFAVIYRESKLRFLLCCVQVIYLFVWISRSAYNGFNLSKYIDQYFDSSDNMNNVDCCSVISLSQITTSVWSLIGRSLTYDLWSSTGNYRRRMNLITFTFTLNPFAQKLYCLLRRQKPKIYKPEVIKDSHVCEIFSIQGFLFNMKMSLKEYILYCFMNRPVPENVMKEIPIFRKLTKKEILEFDLVSTQPVRGLWCRPEKFLYLIRATVISLLFLVIFTVTCSQVPFYLIDIYNRNGFSTDCTGYLNRVQLIFLAFLNITPYIDSFTLVFVAYILTDRLFIYNVQLLETIKQLRIGTNIQKNNVNTYYDQSRFDAYESNEETRNYKTPATQNSYYVTTNNDIIMSRHGKTMTLPISSRVVQQSFDEQCERLIKILHQLLFELKLMKAQFANRTDLDILISLCSYTWVLSTWLVSHQCDLCDQEYVATNWPIKFITVVGNGYLLNVIFQVFYLARISQNVSHLFMKLT